MLKLSKIGEYMQEVAKNFGQICLKNKLIISTAESCTAGLISATIASVPNSSAWLECGFVVYSADAKNKILGVKLETIEKFNITSVQVASEMALGSLEKCNCNVSIAVTGVAGPSGGSDDIPVGTVCIAFAYKNKNGDIELKSTKQFFQGDRNTIRQKVVVYCLEHIIKKYEN